MMERKFQSIGISRLRIENDGDGVTTLVAGYGCPLRCRYCLNPQCFMGKPFKGYDLKELVEELKIDDLYFQATGGGVVFGGGEPLLQADFIREFCRKRPSEWKMSLESSLSVAREELEKVAEYMDYFLIDVKDMNPDIYKAYTGKSIDNLVGNLNYLKDNVDLSKVVIRLPLIPGFNTDDDRKNSREVLEKLGYTRFNLFDYQTEMPLKKAETIKAKEKKQ